MPRSTKKHTRTYGKALLSMGMVNFPIDTYNAIDKDHGVKRNQFVKGTDHPIGYMTVDKTTGEAVSGEQIDKKIATEYGHVYVEDHEIEALFSLTPDTIKVLEFQPQHLFSMGHYIPKGLLYAVPGKTTVGKGKKVLPATTEAFSVFMAAMKVRGLMALVEFTNRGVPKPAILLPNGNLWLIHHTEEIKEPPPVDLLEVPDEIAHVAADRFFEGMVTTEVKDWTDERTSLILNFATEKARAGDFARSEEPEAPAEPAAPAGGLMDMLRASVEQAKKAQSA